MPYEFSAEAASVADTLGGNIAGSVAVNAIRNHTAARISDGATVESDTTVDLLANLRRQGPDLIDAGRVHSVTQAGQAAFSLLASAGASAAGSASLDGDLTEAVIGDGAAVIAPDGVEVRAKTDHDFEDRAVGGSLSQLFAASVGAAFNFTNSRTSARVEGGSVTVSSGNLNVQAESGSPYSPEALGMAAAGLIEVGGSLEGNAQERDLCREGHQPLRNREVRVSK